jgi:hypothetical protein
MFNIVCAAALILLSAFIREALSNTTRISWIYKTGHVLFAVLAITIYSYEHLTDQTHVDMITFLWLIPVFNFTSQGILFGGQGVLALMIQLFPLTFCLVFMFELPFSNLTRLLLLLYTLCSISESIFMILEWKQEKPIEPPKEQVHMESEQNMYPYFKRKRFKPENQRIKNKQ